MSDRNRPATISETVIAFIPRQDQPLSRYFCPSWWFEVGSIPTAGSAREAIKSWQLAEQRTEVDKPKQSQLTGLSRNAMATRYVGANPTAVIDRSPLMIPMTIMSKQ